MVRQKNNETVRRLYEEVINVKNLDTIASLIDPNIIIHDPTGGYSTGIQEYKELLNANFQAVVQNPDFHYEIKNVAAVEDFVYVHAKCTAGQGGEEEVIKTVVDIYRLVDGLIAEHWSVQEMVPDYSTSEVKPANDHPYFETSRNL